MNLKLQEYGGLRISGKTMVWVAVKVVEGYKMKYWIGLSNLEHRWVPQTILFPLPILGKAVWSTSRIICVTPVCDKLYEFKVILVTLLTMLLDNTIVGVSKT